MRSAYLLRAYEVGGYGFQRIESEFIYTTLSGAMDKVDSLKKLKLYGRFEILEYQVDSRLDKAVSNHWHFGHSGQPVTISSLIRSQFPCGVYTEGEDFSLGTFVIPQVLSKWDYSLNDMLPISVISSIPTGEESLYSLESINDLGFLERDHFTFCELKTQFQVYPYSLPVKYSFLDELSRHYRKLCTIDGKLLKRVYNGEVFLFNIETYY